MNICIIFLSFISLSLAEICTDNVCEFQLTVRRVRTMTYFKEDGSASYNVELDGKQLKIVPNSLRLEGSDDLLNTYVDPSKVVTAGGYIRNVIVINNQFPGPTIEVMEGSEVIVHVTNHLRLTPLSIHWHGLYMQKTPWMDGVSYITQCPVQPRQTFTYRFRAHPAGTHWYHAHLENLRVDGLYGMFIIHQRVPPIPYHTAMIADWWHHDAETIEILNPWALFYKGTGEMHLDVPVRDYTPDGVQLGAMDHDLYTTIINGRGRGKNGETYPLEVFTVQENGRVRIRMVHAGAEYPYYVSVDDHHLFVVASDGYEMEPIEVTHIIIQPGESTDFELEGNQAVGNYWFRVRTIRAGTDFSVKPDNIVREGLSIVRYAGASEVDPTTNYRTCTEQDPCIVFNCPFGGFPDKHFTMCKGFNDAKSTMPKAQLDQYYGVGDEEFEEYFFTFAFSVGSGVNGKKFINPTVPLYQDYEDSIVKCDMDCSKGCWCTQMVDLPFNKTVQMIFSNIEPTQTVFSHHPIHVHGHGFAVMKVGYPKYNQTTGLWTEPNDDVLCKDRWCNPARWNGQRPTDLNQDNPPLKDTLTIPARGYAVLRFRTDNPGFWLVHCHAEQHIMDGMAIVFNEAPELTPYPPKNFPKCENYAMTDEEFRMYDDTKYGSKPNMPDGGKDGSYDKPKPEPEDGSDPEPKPESESVMVTMPLAIGSAFGFILVGGFLATVPMMMYICCVLKRNEKAVGSKDMGHANGAYIS